ncbi:MAG: DUF4112 domain-containing protein [Bdellovibrionota bacterium]
MMNEKDQKTLQRVRMLGQLMDSKFEGPFGIRFGLDGILGFVPFLGDIITTLISFSILVSAAQLGATPATLIRMGMNILFENLVDMIPVLGSIFDFWFQSNNRNVKILEDQMKNPEKVSVTSRVILLAIILLILMTLFAVIYLSWMMFQFFIGLIS